MTSPTALSPRPSRLAAVALATGVLAWGCAARPSRGDDGVDVLVLAPHPDDEVLMAGGVLAAAVRDGRRAAVVVLTNGDATCRRDGWVRQGETRAALASLGVGDVEFLGFPDGHLAELGQSPLRGVERRERDGRCAEAAASAGDTPRPLTAEALTRALADVLARRRPAHVYLPHPADEHPDHAMTYAFFRRALERVATAPVVHRAFVHAGPCWPQGRASDEPCGGPPLALDSPLPALPGELVRYAPDERVAVDARRKLALIGHYRSQLDATLEEDWLAAFARTDEAFFTERLAREDGRWVRTPAGEEGVMASVAPGALELRVPFHVGGERFDVSASAGEVRLDGPGFRRRWPVPPGDSGPFLLEAELRRDEGGVQVFHLWAPDGYAGAAVRMPPSGG